jgi:hypothetical protein
VYVGCRAIDGASSALFDSLDNAWVEEVQGDWIHQSPVHNSITVSGFERRQYLFRLGRPQEHCAVPVSKKAHQTRGMCVLE